MIFIFKTSNKKQLIPSPTGRESLSLSSTMKEKLFLVDRWLLYQLEAPLLVDTLLPWVGDEWKKKQSTVGRQLPLWGSLRPIPTSVYDCKAIVDMYSPLRAVHRSWNHGCTVRPTQWDVRLKTFMKWRKIFDPSSTSLECFQQPLNGRYTLFFQPISLAGRISVCRQQLKLLSTSSVLSFHCGHSLASQLMPSSFLRRRNDEQWKDNHGHTRKALKRLYVFKQFWRNCLNGRGPAVSSSRPEDETKSSACRASTQPSIEGWDDARNTLRQLDLSYDTPLRRRGTIKAINDGLNCVS